jgi:hypothetical protein
MRFPLILLAGPLPFLAACAQTAYVQSPPPPPPAYASQPPPPPPPPDAAATLSPLDQLCAPIALYPDPLVSLVLPASTFPSQISAAASYLQGGGDPSGVDQMPWDASVKGLSHYPTVVEWMGGNGAWTSQLGGAFASQPAAVMDAIQELRRQAQAVGSLVNTPQQQVVVYQNAVQIVPAQAEVIYVPQYDPAVVYVVQPGGFNAAFFGWGRPYSAGIWLSYGFDWHSHAVYTGDWYHYHQQMGGWNHPVDYAQVSVDVRFNSRGWQPPRNAPPPPPQLAFRSNVNVNVNVNAQARFAQPRPMAGAPRPPAGAAHVQAMVQNRPAARLATATPAQGQRPTQAQHPQPQQAHSNPPVRTDEQKRAAQQKAQQQRAQQHPAAARQTDAQKRQADAQKAQQQKKPAPKKAPPKKTPEEVERDRKAQEGAQHAAPPS